MRQEIYPIGSVIKVENTKVMIIGIHLYAREDKMVLDYSVVPYPLGCMSENSVGLLSTRTKLELVSKGYENEITKRILQRYQNIDDMIDEISLEEFEEEMCIIKEQLQGYRREVEANE